MAYKIIFYLDSGMTLDTIYDTQQEIDNIIEQIMDIDILATRFISTNGKKRNVVIHDKIQYITSEEI